MCEPLDTLRIEVIDSRHITSEQTQPILDAAFAADRSVTCCLERRNAVHRAVFDTARQQGLRVAWGDILDPEAPAYIFWPADTWRTTFIREYLADRHANEIQARDLNAVKS